MHNSSNTMELFQILESWWHLIELVFSEPLSDADKVYSGEEREFLPAALKPMNCE